MYKLIMNATVVRLPFQWQEVNHSFMMVIILGVVIGVPNVRAQVLDDGLFISDSNFESGGIPGVKAVAVEPEYVTAVDTRNNLEGNGPAKNVFVHYINIALHPNDEVIGQGPQTVSFGLPIPPGVLLNTENVSVYDDTGQEIPVFVRSLAAWHRMPPQSLLCEDYYQTGGNPGIRSVLIQFQKEFTNAAAKNIGVLLNLKRTRNISTEIDVQTTLRVVNDGSYKNHSLGFNIFEPKVFAAIVPDYLVCTNLTPLIGESELVPEMAVTDAAQKNFFYTAINEFFDWPVTSDQEINFQSGSYAYWLYDRPQSFLSAYFRSGNIDQLREGLRAAEQYKHNIYTQEDAATSSAPNVTTGYFKAKNPNVNASWKDSKYSYNESLISAYLLTGNKSYLNYIALPKFAVAEVSASGVRTARHKGNALLTTVLDYELTNDSSLLPYIMQSIDFLYNRQQVAQDGGNVINGCFNLAPEGGNVPNFSPWMVSLLSNALLRAYQVVGDERIPDMLVDLALCQIERALFRTDVFANLGAPYLLMPYYIAQSYGEKKDLDGLNPWNSHEHAIDVSVPIALGAYFTTDVALRSWFIEVVRELLRTHEFSAEHWTRSTVGRPVFRLAPPRKYGWQYKNIGIVSRVMGK